MAKKQLSPKYQVWVDARKRFHLTHAQIQMARELGMNPKKLGQKANDHQEPWKVPLPEFAEQLYLKQFGKTRPDDVRSIEQIVQDKKRPIGPASVVPYQSHRLAAPSPAIRSVTAGC